MEQTQRVRPYEGAEAYLFISYAHADAARVRELLTALDAGRYRLWYDEGIEVGADWPEVIARHLSGAAAVLVVLSENALRSPNCMREITFAIDRRKTLFCVQLDDARPEGGMGMQLSVVPALDARTLTGPEAVAALERQGCLTGRFLGDGVTGYAAPPSRRRRQVNGWMLACAALALGLLGAVVAVLGLWRGWFSGGVQTRTVAPPPGAAIEEAVTVTSWSDPAALTLLLSGLDSPSVYLCGNAFVSSAEAIRYANGAWQIAGESAPQAR